MKISYREFNSQLVGARLVDEHRWTNLNQEAALWEMFAFGNDGAYYLSPTEKGWLNAIDKIDQKMCVRFRNDWGARYRDNPSYFEPEEFVIQ